MTNPIPKEGIELLFIGDVHLGRRTESYDSEVFKQYVKVLSKRLSEARAFVTRMRIKLKKRYLVFLGDIVDGENIYPKHPYEQELTIDEQIDMLVDEFTPFIKKADAIVGIEGNHGRTSKYSTGNWDYMLYRVLKERVPSKEYILFPREKGRFNVAGQEIYIAHPRFIRMYQSIPFYGIVQNVMREYVIKPVNIAVFGHFHQIYKYEYSGIQIYGNGTFLSGDELSALKGWKPGLGQWYIVINEDEGVLFERVLRLESHEI